MSTETETTPDIAPATSGRRRAEVPGARGHDHTLTPDKRVKNAWRNAGRQGSLRKFAQSNRSTKSRLGEACEKWLKNKSL